MEGVLTGTEIPFFFFKPTDRYRKKLIPVPGMLIDTQGNPAGDLPMRRPARPQLTPTPLLVNVALVPPPRLVDLRHRQPIKVSFKLT